MTRVLVIEDTAALRENLLLILELEGFEVRGAADGLSGLAQVQDFKPDLILCDIRMPELDGFGVYERLRADVSTCEIPFIFMSARAGQDAIREGMNLGADGYLVKPFGSDALLAAMRARLDKRDRARSREQTLHRRFSILSDGLPVGVVIVDAHGNTRHCNQAAADILGREIAPLLEHWVQAHGILDDENGTLLPPTDTPTARTLADGRARSPRLLWITRPDGEHRPVLMSTKPMVEQDGRVSEVVTTLSDVSELFQARRALDHSERRLRMALGAAKMCTWERHGDQLELTWPDPTRPMIDIDLSSVQAGSPELLDQVHPHDRKALKIWLGSPVDQGTVEFRLGSRKNSARPGLDSWRWLLLSGQVLARDSSGQVLRSVGTLMDISDRKQLERSAYQAQRMESIGRLAGGIAHDFNNVLAVITGVAGLMHDELERSSPLHEELDTILDASRQASGLTRQLLTFARQQEVKVELIDFNKLVQEATRLLDRLLGMNIQLVVRLGTDLGLVKVDPTQMEQVIINLAVNARDAMPSGGQLEIETSSARLDQRVDVVPPGHYVILTVRDTGVGMSQATLQQLFEPFFTTKSSGTGVGLATCHGIVSRLRGHILVESLLGRGSCFRVFLPRIETEPKTTRP